MKYLLIFVTLLTISFYSCNQVTERMPDYSVHGVDVSHYQAQINWFEVAAEGIDFGFVKATEGETISDAHFCQNWIEMKNAGIIRGAYHFFRPNTSAISQAKHFIEKVDLQFGDLPPVLDVEVLDNVNKDVMVARLNIWLDMVEEAFDVQPIIYTNMKFYNQYLADDFANYTLWIARYNDKKTPDLFENKNWDFWQYGNKGKIAGINGPVDLNVFHGSITDLLSITISPFSSPSTAGR